MGKTLLIYGLQHSNFGCYYYIEHGIMIKGTNKNLAWSKYYQVDKERSRISFQLDSSEDKSAIFYKSDFDVEKFANILENSIQNEKSRTVTIL